MAENDRWVVDSSSDSVVMEERDDAFFADVGKTKDHAFVVINLHSKTSSEVHLLPSTSSCRRAGALDGAEASSVGEGGAAMGPAQGAEAVWSAGSNRDNPVVSPTLLRRRQPGVEYYVDHCGDAFYFVTNSCPSTTEAHVGSGGGGSVGENVSGSDSCNSQGAVPAARTAGEYRLVRIRQPGGAASLEGIAEALWESFPLSGGTVVLSASHEKTAAQAADGVGDGGASRAPAVVAAVEAVEDGRGVDAAGEKTASSAPRAGTIQEMDLFREHCVLYESCPLTGSPRLRVVPISAKSSSASFAVSPPAFGNGSNGSGGGGDEVMESPRTVVGASSLRPGVNSWFEARTARFSVSSPTAPEDVYDLCLDSGALRLLKRTDVPGFPRFDGREYRFVVMVGGRCERRLCVAVNKKHGFYVLYAGSTDSSVCTDR